MALLTAEQAATRLKRTERSIRRWIKEGKLQATHPTHGHTSKFLIDEQEVERIAQELEQEQPAAATSERDQDTSSLEQRVNQLEQDVQDYRSTIAALQEKLAHIEQQLSTPPVQAAATETRTRTTRATATTELPADIPASSILYGQFAKNHGVPDGTFKDQIDDKKVPATIIPKPNRPKEKARWLTPEQQRAAIEHWTSNSNAWHWCTVASCPCHDYQQTKQQRPGPASDIS